MPEYKVRRKVTRWGKSSLLITLPKLWTEAQGLEPGDIVEITFDRHPYLKVALAERGVQDQHVSVQTGRVGTIDV